MNRGAGWCQPLFASPTSPAAFAAAEELGALMPLWGLERPWGWQRHLWEIALELGDDGRPRYTTITATICRQNGKTAALAPLVWLWMREGRRILFTLHERKLGLEKWTDIAEALARAEPDRFRVRRRAGGERVTDRESGGFFALVTPDDAGGRSETADVIIIDEGAHVSPLFLRAARATTLTREGAQILMISSGLTAASEDMAVARARAIADLPNANRSAGVLEFAAKPDPGHEGLDLDDEELWARCIPTLGQPGGARLAGVREARAEMSDDIFAREYLSVATGSPLTPPITPVLWDAVQVDGPLVVAELESRVLALDTSPDQRAYSIALAGVDGDGMLRAALLAHHVGDDKTAFDDLVAAYRETGPDEVVIDARSPASYVAQRFEHDAWAEVTTGTAGDMARSCALLFSSLPDGIRVVTDPALTAAALTAVRREIADVGWAWNRRPDGKPITPLVALSMAAFAAYRMER